VKLLKQLPKPEGFELREKRAEKSDDGSKWLPEDALYDASTAMQESPPAGAMIVVWYSLAEGDKYALKYRIWQDGPRRAVGLAADLLGDLTR
jgi:hypothetical protein